MGRRRKSEENAVSLFPFLSILACVIGVLTLVIMSLSVSQLVHGEEEKDTARAEQGAAIKKRIAAMRKEIEALGEDKQAMLQRMKLEEELAALQKKQKTDRATEMAEMKEKIKQVEDAIAAQDLARQELEKKEKQREQELARYEELKKKPKVLIQPSGGRSKIRPQFVEARKDGIVIHAVSKSIPIKLVALATNPDYKKLIGYVRDGSEAGRVIVFLIRQDGLGVYHRARDIALAGDAGVAKLPLLGEGAIDLAAFGIKRGGGKQP